MSITVESTPPIVALAGNPILFKLSSDNQVEIAGQLAILVLTFSATAEPDDTFTLAWGSISITFTCKQFPDDSGKQFQDDEVVSSLNDWVALLVTYLQANYYLNKDFDITSAAAVLTITSKEKLADKTLVFTNGTPCTETSNQAGIDLEYWPVFRLGVQTLIKDGSNFNKVAEDLQPVDENSEAYFDIHKPLKPELSMDFKFPEASDTIIIARDLICREYKINYFEHYGTIPENKKVSASSSFYVLNGGISFLQEAIYNRQESNFWVKLSYNQYFLSWQPLIKTIDKWQVEKLYFLVQGSHTTLKLKIKIYYNDETPTSTITKDTIGSPVQYKVYEICITNNILQVTGWDSEIIEKIEVWFDDEGDQRVSEIRTYIYDYSYQENARYFMFLNSLGGRDTIRTTGQGINELEYDRSEINKVLSFDFTEKDRQISQLKPTERKTFKVNTGWKTEDDIEWLRDLLLSIDIHQIIAGKLVPINIISKKVFQKKDNDKLFFLEFEYKRAFTDNYYTKEIVAAKYDDDFNDDHANA